MPINCLINSEQIVNNSCSKNQFMVNSWINSWTLMFQKTVLSPFVLRPPSLPLFVSSTLRLFLSLSFWLLVSSSLRPFDSLTLPLFVFSATQDFRCPIKKEAWRASLFLLMRCHVFTPPFVFQNLWREDTSRMFYELRNKGVLKKVHTFSP